MPLLFCHVNGRLIHGFGSGFLTDGFDVPAFVVDVLDVDVDHGQADFFHFRGNGFIDFCHKCLAVAVDFLDLHGGNHRAHLPEDDVLRLALDFFSGQAQEANGRVLHDPGLVGNGRRDCGGHGYADVFLRKRVVQIDGHDKGFEVEVFVILQQGQDERRAAVNAFRG